MFEPDNDTDDYTAVTAYINEEFARVKAEEVQQQATETVTKNKNVTENVTEKLPQGAAALLMNYSNKKRVTAEKIMKAILSDATITISRIIEISGTSDRTVKRYLKEFKDGNVLKRQGSDISGQWFLY